MSNKTEALVRDLALLFVRYRLSDWAPVVDELERRGGSIALTEAIRRHAEEARSFASAHQRAKKKPLVKRTAPPPKAVQPDMESRFVGPHASTIEQLREALVAKRALRALPRLKAVHAALGIKVSGKPRREVLIANLAEHLDGLDNQGFEKALRTVAQEEERGAAGTTADYDRWFHLITANRKALP